MRTSRYLLPWLMALLVARDVQGQQCTPCRDVDCSPLPSNCKYGATLDHCGCCKICIQSNGEVCHFVTDSSGVGFICEWAPPTASSKKTNHVIVKQLRHPVGLETFFRFFINSLQPKLNSQAHHSEQFKTYPTCGIYDYLTSTGTDNHEISTEPSRQAAQGSSLIGGALNANSNVKGTFVGQKSMKANTLTKLLLLRYLMKVSSAEMRRPLKDEVESRGEKRGKKGVEGLKSERRIESFLKDGAKPISRSDDQESRGGEESRLSSNVRREHKGVFDGGMKEHKDEGRSRQVENGSSTETTGGAKSSIAKTGELGNLLGGTLSDIIRMFVDKARAMYEAKEKMHGDVENKTDPIRTLRFMLERKRQEKLKEGGRIAKKIGRRTKQHKITARKFVGEKVELGEQERLMEDAELSSNKIEEDGGGLGLGGGGQVGGGDHLKGVHGDAIGVVKGNEVGDAKTYKGVGGLERSHHVRNMMKHLPVNKGRWSGEYHEVRGKEDGTEKSGEDHQMEEQKMKKNRKKDHNRILSRKKRKVSAVSLGSKKP